MFEWILVPRAGLPVSFRNKKQSSVASNACSVAKDASDVQTQHPNINSLKGVKGTVVYWLDLALLLEQYRCHLDLSKHFIIIVAHAQYTLAELSVAE